MTNEDFAALKRSTFSLDRYGIRSEGCAFVLAAEVRR